MRVGEGFLLVYSITSRDSFEDAMVFHQQILRARNEDSFPVILVANKCDLEHERQVGSNGTHPPHILLSTTLRHLLTVMTAEGREIAKRLGGGFIETSAKLRINVEEAFSNLVREIRKSKVRSPLSHWSFWN